MPYNVEEILKAEEFEPYVERFREHYDRFYNDQPTQCENVLPAYYHGFVIASCGRSGVATPHWDYVEDEARRKWDNPNPWESISDAVKHAWNDITGNDE